METSNYLKGTDSLEQRIQKSFGELKISPEQQESIRAFLAPLRTKGEAGNFHYEHSLRVGLLARAIGAFIHVDEKALFYAGLLHDVGKALVPIKTLSKTDSWTQEDIKNIELHVMDGYRLLRDKFDFTAQIILWHHRFQANCYPQVLPPVLQNFSTATTVTIEMYGRLLMMADVFDALHRINFQAGQKRAFTGQEIRKNMLRFNQDLKILVENLYRVEIFPQI